MLATVALLLTASTTFSGTSRTSWMRPESFHLVIGMPRAAAMQTLAERGWEVQKGDDADQAIVDYTSTKSLTLQFRKDRLHSIRFELFGLSPEVQDAFAEEKAYLAKEYGNPKPTRSKTTVIYEGMLPNVMAVMTDNGRKGLSLLAVRYFDPR